MVNASGETPVSWAQRAALQCGVSAAAGMAVNTTVPSIAAEIDALAINRLEVGMGILEWLGRLE
jgi:hypothetical protein